MYFNELNLFSIFFFPFYVHGNLLLMLYHIDINLNLLVTKEIYYICFDSFILNSH